MEIKLKECCKCHKESRIWAEHMCLACFRAEYPDKFKIKPSKVKPAPTVPLKKTKLKPSKKPIKQRSDKSQKKYEEYLVARAAYLLEHPMCEVCKIAPATEIHHKKKRFGENLMKHFLAVCRPDHVKIEANPAWAFDKGYSIPHLNKEDESENT